MKNRNLENRLAYLGALVVLIGVTAAATSAFAAEAVEQDGAIVSELDATREAASATVIGARAATAESAAEAAAALEAEIVYRLENQLSDISSTLIAANR